MVSKYKKTDKDIFSFNDLKAEFPDYSDDFLSKSLYSLQHKGYVAVDPADNIAYTTTLLCDGIAAVEEDTLFKKVHSFLKELRSLFS